MTTCLFVTHPLANDQSAVQFLKLGENDFIHKPFCYQEFCAIIHGKGLEDAVLMLENIGMPVADDALESSAGEIKVTVSIGVCSHQK